MSAEPTRDPSSVPAVTALSQTESPDRLIGAALRQLRLEREMTLQEVAAAQEISVSYSKLCRMETGKSPVKERDLRDLLRHYRAPRERQDMIAGLLREDRRTRGEKTISDLTPQWLERLILLEDSARRITAFERNVVPGLLQTREYARELVHSELKAEGAAHDEVTVDSHVRQRLWRWDSFEQRADCELEVIIGEASLRQLVGGYAVMREQMERLREVATGPRVILRIHPFDGGSLLAPRLPVTHLQFDDGGPQEVVYSETVVKAEYIVSLAHVERTRERLMHAKDGALTRVRSLEMLEHYVEKYQRLMDRSAGES
ncbi:helix-turn-helix domain-containing protein [Streptomyces zagrosensis]|uniref:Transcriptional regulator with XRE-family HTH domain n=1 Tax=Streptomyces zagrosensis TaxID=1042984 RepID=A0A7W9V274_9ACTN|nr:helix-turn-helix transcriptional regulator [Streptomyces zagrosensis]MBB5938549.1 transcriptional regulator with XRE-family HTH domain [Streptomyces zagrosensis]